MISLVPARMRGHEWGRVMDTLFAGVTMPQASLESIPASLPPAFASW
jgi:hypothetical protein